MTQRQHEFVRHYWPVVAGVLALAAAWGTNTAQIASIAKSQETMSAKIDTIKEDLSETKTVGRYAMQEVKDLRDRVHAIELRR